MERTYVKILSYNFFLKPDPSAYSPVGDQKDERIKDFCELHLQDYDIICF